MKFHFNIPVDIYFEKNCVVENQHIFSNYGSRAFIVTGRHSAKACGALADVAESLKKQNIAYEVFEEIENNPSTTTIVRAVKRAREFGTDMVIGIGGGSPIDASKAIAVLVRNSDMKVEDLFANDFTQACPMIAIPTAAGTGSEATPYSVLLVEEKQTKISFGNVYTYPTVAFLDYRYTKRLGEKNTINTAVDAFTHAFEGFLANRSTWLSEALSIEAIRYFGSCIKSLLEKNFTDEVREKLMYVSLLGGIIIAQTGVTIAHGMGYCLTFFKDIPHGRANGLLMKEYMDLNASCVKEKINLAMKIMNTTQEEFACNMEKLVGTAPELTEEECCQYTQLTLLQKGSIANTPYSIQERDIYDFWKKYESR